MARTVRSRREAYDNIAIGSAISARERTIAGSLPPDFTTYGMGENTIAVGVDTAIENHTAVGVDPLTGERVGGA